MAFLDLLARKKLNLKPIIDDPIAFEHAEDVYEMLRKGKNRLGVLFKYSDSEIPDKPMSQTISLKTPTETSSIVLGCIGAGNYANTKLLPVLAGNSNVRLKTVATTTGTSCKTAALRFGFEQAATDNRQLFEDKEVNTIIIATPHRSHAQLISKALKAGKTVFSEKPLAINEEQLGMIKKAVEESGNGRLQVGFNRRFAPLSVRIKETFSQIMGPLHILIRVNAGRIKQGNWVSDPEQSGGRFIGEGCHFVDLASFFIGEEPVETQALQIGPDMDDICVQLLYSNHSVATIVYVTSGSPLVPKERIEVYGGGWTAILDDFKQLVIYGNKKKKFKLVSQNKGQKEQLLTFCNAILKGREMPIPIESLFTTTDATFKAIQSLRTNRIETLEKPNIINK